MALTLVSLIAVPVFAAPGGKVNDSSQNLYLYPKEPPPNPTDPEWIPVLDGAWGKFNYRIDGQIVSGVFNGHGLVAVTDYTLISYNDPWGADPAFVVIGNDIADKNGNVHIAAKSVDLGLDVASPIYDWNGAEDGYKIWLVLTDDIDAQTSMFTGWNYASYLFENNRIGATGP